MVKKSLIFSISSQKKSLTLSSVVVFDSSVVKTFCTLSSMVRVFILSSVVKESLWLFHQWSKKVFDSFISGSLGLISCPVCHSFISGETVLTLSSVVKKGLHSFMSSQRESSSFHQWSKKVFILSSVVKKVFILSSVVKRKLHSFISSQRKCSFFHQQSKKVFLLSSAVKESPSRWLIFATSSCRQWRQSSQRRRWRGRGRCWTLCTREWTVCRRQLFRTPHEFVLHWDRPQEFDWQSGEIQDYFIISSEKLKCG